MNQTYFQYVEDWSETNITRNNSYNRCFLTSSQIKWANIENSAEFLSKEIKINYNGLFEEERRLNAYLNSKTLEQLENQHAEIDKRWVKTLKPFKKMNTFRMKIWLFLLNLRCTVLELMQQLKEFIQLVMIFGQV
ncbi:hypothetical protein TNCV_2885151 [Trichonephila clavipes]|nr:hypothetical protein TNCV_2885151 [Trichonephila clavipes]